MICLGLPIVLSRIKTEVIPTCNIHLHTFSLYTCRVLLLTCIFKCLQVHLNYLYLSSYQICNSTLFEFCLVIGTGIFPSLYINVRFSIKYSKKIGECAPLTKCNGTIFGVLTLIYKQKNERYIR